MSLQIKRIDPLLDSRWDDYVFKNDNSNIYHHSAWGHVIQSSFGYKPLYLVLEDSEKNILGGIPFFYKDGILSKKKAYISSILRLFRDIVG